MDDLVTFLTNMLHIVEARADRVHFEECSTVAQADGWAGGVECDCGEPRRIHADIAAKRRTIELYRAIEDSRMAADAWVALKEVLRHLAAGFTTHPDYQARWAL